MANADGWAALTHDDLSHGPIQNIAYWLGQIGFAPTSSSQVFNVTDPKFGAKVDGVTDDTNAWIAAIAAATAAGGGTISMPQGTSLVLAAKTPKGLNLTSNITIQGAGMNASRILGYLAGGGTGTILHMSGTQATVTSPIALAQTMRVRDLTIDCNGGVYSGITALGMFWFYDIAVSNVRITNSFGNGRFAAMPPQNFCFEQWRLSYQDCVFDTFGNTHQIEMFEINNIENVVFRRCEFANFQVAAIDIYQITRDVLVDDCWFHDGYPALTNSTTSHGVVYKNSSPDITVQNCTFERLWNGIALNAGSHAPQTDNYGFWTDNHLRFIGNVVESCQSGAELGSPTAFEISHNEFSNLAQNGINYAASGTPRRGQIVDNLIRNCAQAGTGAGLSIQSPTALTANCDVLVQRNHFVDDQSTPTMNNAISVSGAGQINGITFEGNDFTGVQAAVSLGAASWGPTTVFRNNPGYNPLNVLSSPPALNTTAKATQNTANVDTQVFLSGGTVSSVAVGALPEPTITPVVTVLGSGGSGFTTGASTLGLAIGTHTALSPTASFTIAAATNSLVVSALPTPTAALVLTNTAASDPLPAGTYTIGYSWFNDFGETPIGPTANITINAGDHINYAQIAGVPTGVLGARLYFLSPSPVIGLADIMGVSGVGGNLPANSFQTLPFAIPKPTTAPVVVDSGLAGQFAAGTYTFAYTYVTVPGIETLAGTVSGNVTVANNHALTVGPFNLDSSVQVANGAIVVQWIRVYAVSGPVTGLVAQVPMIVGNPCSVAAVTVYSLLSAQVAPTVDLSIPKTNTAGATFRTDGFPHGFTAWLTTGGSSWSTALSGVGSNGSSVPALLIVPGSSGTSPTTNTTGTQIATTTPAQFRVPAGSAFVVTHTGAPTAVWLAE